MAEEDCCGNCRFFRRKACHRLPPVVVFRVEREYNGVCGQTETQWPDVDAGEWCGEHKQVERRTG